MLFSAVGIKSVGAKRTLLRRGLSDGTRTHGLHHPKVARYQTALHPDKRRFHGEEQYNTFRTKKQV